VQASDRQAQWAHDGAHGPLRRQRAEQTTPCCLAPQHAESVPALVLAATGASLPQSVTDEFDVFLECGSARTNANVMRLDHIAQAYRVSDATEGVPPIRAAQTHAGILVGRNPIARLMRADGLHGVRRRRCLAAGCPGS
jgi:hypothetical protein